MSPKVPLSPREQYALDIQRDDFFDDPCQAKVVDELQRMYEALRKRQVVWRHMMSNAMRPVKGLYVWGPVGTGKTYCMDLFYHSIPGDRKLRMHFHAFMRMIHAELKKHQGQKNPLQKIIAEIAKQRDVLCFDEFLVNDIGDAMLLYGVLDALHRARVMLVCTSNSRPERLYWRGTSRELFLPAIARIQLDMTVLACDPARDYRLVSSNQSSHCFSPLNEASHQALEKVFQSHAGSPPQRKQLVVNGRSVSVLGQVGSVVWLDMMTWCRVPRGVEDYLWLAEHHEQVIISACPDLHAVPSAVVVNWMHLIDVLYDAKRMLWLSTAVPLDHLYTHGPLLDPWQRTYSRLVEMCV